MSQRALSPRQFFHGSPEHLEPGAEIRPSAVTGRPTTRGDSKPDKVYVTPYEFVAAQYTWKYGDDGKLADDPKKGPSGHVYEVEPIGQRRRDPNGPRHLPDASYEVKAARVVRRLDPKEWH